MKYFENARVLTAGRGIVTANLCFGERIVSVGEERGDERISLPADAVVLPGFIDEHIHGAGGADAMDGTREALSVISRTLVKEGTTSFLATTMTQSEEKIGQALRAADAFCTAGDPAGARLLGVHLEGPFIAAAHKGAQPLEFVAAPSAETFRRFEAASGDRIRIVTLAPEEAGAEDLISYLVSRGIVVSVGHTGAKYADIERAAAAGATNITHTYNAQSPLHHREIGTVGSALLLDELNCELICDGIHVSVPAMRLLKKCKPSGKLTLITDAMRAKGLPDGVSELGGQTVFVKGGEARLADGTLAGSVLRMNHAVRNLVQKVGVPLEEAVGCATLTPARTLGVDRDLGSIECGKLADFAVLGSDFEVICTVRGGEIVYRAS